MYVSNYAQVVYAHMYNVYNYVHVHTYTVHTHLCCMHVSTHALQCIEMVLIIICISHVNFYYIIFIQGEQVFPLPIYFRPNVPQQLHHHMHKTIKVLVTYLKFNMPNLTTTKNLCKLSITSLIFHFNKKIIDDPPS